MITFEIDEPTPSLNKLLRGHWSKNHKLRSKWSWLVRAGLSNANYFARPQLQKAKITIERYGSRVLDTDNCRGGTKYLTDSLVQHGILLNDTPAVIGEPVIFQMVGKERKTVVRIEVVK